MVDSTKSGCPASNNGHKQFGPRKQWVWRCSRRWEGLTRPCRVEGLSETPIIKVNRSKARYDICSPVPRRHLVNGSIILKNRETFSHGLGGKFLHSSKTRLDSRHCESG